MENKYLFSHNIYEVISDQVNKYSSTSVYGGEQGTSVKSSTTLHSDQSIWLRDLQTGKERKLECETFNISVRPGHKFACIWHETTGELEAVKNFSTQLQVLGINNLSKNKLCTWAGLIFLSLVTAFFFLIPYAGTCFCFFIALLGITPVCNLKTKLIPGYRLGLFVAGFFYIFLGQAIVNHFSGSFENIFSFMKNVFFLNVVIVFSGCFIANNFVVKGREELKKYLSAVTESPTK